MAEINFENILIIGPSSKRMGGIASVIKNYKEHFNSYYFSSTHFQNTTLTFIFFIERIFALIIKLIVNKKIKIVHIHGSHRGSFLRKYVLFKICKLFRKKIVYHIHSGTFHFFYEQSNKFLKQRIKSVFEKSDTVIVLSQSWKEYFQKTFKKSNVETLPNMILRPTENDFSKKNHNPIKIVYLGKIFKEKGIYDLLDCIVKNYNYYEDKTAFLICGNGEENKTRAYKDLDKKGIIHFMGWIDSDKKKEVLSSSHILILPSYNEGLPVSVLEAMSYRMPIISTPVGGIPEIVKDGFNGKLVNPGNLYEIHEAIKYYIENKDLIVTHGENSYSCVQSNFPEKIGKKLLSIYNSIN